MEYKEYIKNLGNTPLIRLNAYEKKYKIQNNIYAKLEKNNPSGSVKDRASYYMINEALKKGLINENSVIIEPTSGNTGIGLALFGSILRLKVIIVMPISMSEERRKLIRNYGATLELVDGTMQDCINRAKELCKTIPNSFIPSQFDNESNVLAHYETTGPEILEQLHNVDIVVCGIGSGGTISGIGKFLKEKNPYIKIIGVEPKQSPFITSGIRGSHKIQGIGAGFIPKILDLKVVDEIITVDEDLAIEKSKSINETENLFVGISSGAVLVALDQINQKEKNKNIVLIFPDGGERYSWN